MRPRLLLLVTSSAWGGAERYVAAMAKAAASGFDVTVMAGRSKTGELFRAVGAPVRGEVLPDLVHAISPVSDFRAAIRLRAFLEREKIDLLHCNSSKAGWVGALAAAGARRRPAVLYTAHGWGFSEARPWPFRSMVLAAEWIATRGRDATIVLSAAEERIGRRFGLAPSRGMHRIGLGIDAGEIDFLDRAAARRLLLEKCGKIGPVALLIGTIANAFPPKNLPGLIQAFTAMKAGPPPCHLIVIGDGPDMARVREARDASSRRESVHLLGAIPEAACLLRGFDMFVLASTKEGMPWTILEACLAGVPVIATRVGAIPEMIRHGVDGLLVEPGSPDRLARAMDRAAADGSLRESLGRNAAEASVRRSGRGMVESTLKLYRRLAR